MSWPPPANVVLTGTTVRVRRADADADSAALCSALSDPQLWTHVRGRPADAAGWRQLLTERSSLGWHTWIVEATAAIGDRRPGDVVGTSSYLEIAPDDARLEIGATTYVRDVWGTAVNPETKLLLIGYAFETLGAGRVQLKTDIRNRRSAQAIERLGARFEGTLRRYQRRADATVRDTVLFSVIAEEWPAVRAGLVARVAAAGGRSPEAG